MPYGVIKPGGRLGSWRGLDSIPDRKDLLRFVIDGPEALHPAPGLNGRRGRGGGAGHDTPGPTSHVPDTKSPRSIRCVRGLGVGSAGCHGMCHAGANGQTPASMLTRRSHISSRRRIRQRNATPGLPIPYGWMAPAFNTPMDPIWARGAASPAVVETFFTCYVLRVTC